MIIVLEGKPILICKSQRLKIWITSKLDHGWWTAHEDLYFLSCLWCVQMLLNHFLGNESCAVLPPLWWIIYSVI